VYHLLGRVSLLFANSQYHEHMSSCIQIDIMNEMS